MRENHEDKILICEECGNEFIFPGIIKIEDVEKENVEEMKKLFKKREMLEEWIEKLKTKNFNSDIESLKKELKYYETKIIQLSDSFSREAFVYYGIEMDPTRCKDCIIKIDSKKMSKKIWK